jgi:hypothetical protein
MRPVFALRDSLRSLFAFTELPEFRSGLPVLRRRLQRVGIATVAACGLALATTAHTATALTAYPAGPAAVVSPAGGAGAPSAAPQRLSGSTGSAAATPTKPLDGGAAPATATVDAAGIAVAAKQKVAAAAAKTAAAVAAAAKAAADAKWRADNPTPVAGLSQLQMNNALRIVNEGKALGLPSRAYVLAVACAMQESQLLNLASSVLPESFNYPHEGYGSDHDSVGLFQQRPSSGWGSVPDLMTPAYAAKQFYDALVSIPGWDTMALSYAIQTVQGSAYPDAYAAHEWAAQTVVDALG